MLLAPGAADRVRDLPLSDWSRKVRFEKMNILEIVVIVVTIALILSGFRAGFVRKLASMLSLVLSIALVSAILPYVTDFIKNNTPLYDYIVEQCENVAAEQLSGLWTSSGTESSGLVTGSLTREEAKALMEQYGYGAYTSMVDSLTDEEFEAYKEQYLEQYASQLQSESGGGECGEQWNQFPGRFSDTG